MLKKNEYKVSIITPFYNGNKYMEQYIYSISKAVDKFNDHIEIVLVNDSPNVDIKIKNDNNNISIKIVNNVKNVGIQKSRINGLLNAAGKYIIFLDQDDILLENSICSQYNSIISDSKIDIVVGNGYDENNGKLIYKSKYSLRMATIMKPFIMSRNLIISPGQCIIKKDSIPKEWINNAIVINGADDYYLWILMFASKKKFVANNSINYVHKDTGNNLSADNDNMYNSEIEMISFLKNKIQWNDYNKLKRSIQFRKKYKMNKVNLINIIRNIDVIFYKLFCAMIFRIVDLKLIKKSKKIYFNM